MIDGTQISVTDPEGIPGVRIPSPFSWKIFLSGKNEQMIAWSSPFSGNTSFPKLLIYPWIFLFWNCCNAFKNGVSYHYRLVLPEDKLYCPSKTHSYRVYRYDIEMFQLLLHSFDTWIRLSVEVQSHLRIRQKIVTWKSTFLPTFLILFPHPEC